MLDTAFFYNVSGLGSYVSPFGEMVRRFIREVVVSSTKKFHHLSLIIHLATNFTSRAACTYIFLGLDDLATTIAFDNSEYAILGPLQVLQVWVLLASSRSVSIWTKSDSRRLFCRLSTNVCIKFCDRTKFSFWEVSNLLSGLNFSPSSGLFNEVREWCLRGFGEVTGKKWLVSEIELAIENFIRTTESSPSTEVHEAHGIATMVPLLSTLEDINLALQPMLARVTHLYTSSPYAPRGTYRRVVLLLHAMHEMVGSETFHRYFEGTNLTELESACKSVIYEPSLMDIAAESPFDSLRKFRVILSECLLHNSAVTAFSLEKFVTDAVIRILSKILTFAELFSSIMLLSLAFEIAFKLNMTFLSAAAMAETLNAVLGDLIWAKLTSHENKNWSEIQNEIETAKYECAQSILRYAGSKCSAEVAFTALKHCGHAVSVSSTSSAPMIFATAKLAIPIVLNSMSFSDSLQEIVLSLLADGLLLVSDNEGNAKHFLSVVKSFAEMAFCPALLKVSVGQESIRFKLIEVFELFMRMAETRMSVLTCAITPLFDCWCLNLSTDDSIFILSSFQEAFEPLLLFGPARDCAVDANRLDAAISSILNSYESPFEESVGTAESNLNMQDYVIRVKSNDILLHLKLTMESHRTFAVGILKRLLDSHLSNAYPAKFDSTFEHRMQVRSWCSIHLLMDHIKEPDGWFDVLVRCMDVDTMVSTRYYIEWAVIRFLLRFDIQSTFYANLFRKLLPWMTANHFVVRLYVQHVVDESWKYCERSENLREITEQFESSIGAMLQFVRTNADCKKHRQQIDGLYFLGGRFDPIQDLSVDFIFRGGLLLAGVTEEERISARAFERLTAFDTPGSITMFHSAERMELWTTASGNSLKLPEHEFEDLRSEIALQRKIEPWQTMLQTDFDFSATRQVSTNRRKRFSIIIVASLISKAPNLGGLTCEIFNAESFVVNNLKVREDPAFLVTAVTAEKWVQMEEVREGEALVGFLLNKRKAGYSIVGVEQATSSVSLSDFRFPEKVVLLLGKEKLGIPAPYMAVLDRVLEIRQFGVVRSLNVHVSGALVLYEYAQQRAEDASA
ncbi:Tar (HIV-1) RNA binding protein 1 [Entophlyctis sp. JEL0112]|nr:Tar (HIV-1) RNA binding protein 1 [Entophlyctis sp. JEL0112]